MAAHANTVKIIVPYAPGGGGDQVARLLSAHLNEKIKGYNFPLDFQVGAGGAIAAQNLANTTGSETVIMLHSLNVIVNSIGPDAKYNLKQFRPILVLGGMPMVLSVKANGPVSTLPAFLKTPNTIFYGSAGIGSGGYVAMAMLQNILDKDMIHVPYKGEAPALVDLAAGQVTATFSTVGAAVPLYEANKINIIGITGKRRSTTLPAVPTLLEQGIKGMDGPINWMAIFVNNSADPALVNKIQTALFDAVKENSDAYSKLGLDLSQTSKDNVPGFIEQENLKMQRMLSKIGASK